MKFGVKINRKGADFTVHSTTERLWLMLFDQPSAAIPAREIEMTRHSGFFHLHVPRVKPGALYLYRADETQWLIDPCARAVQSPNPWGNRTGYTEGEAPKTGKMFPKGVVVSDRFKWGKDRRPRRALEDTVIYEAHLRGFTRDGAEGTYLDIIEKIPYLAELGITAIEFLPLFDFDELEYYLSGKSRQHLLNFWGYSTRSFFAPMSRYARSTEPGAVVEEFKTMVKELHAAGIEVILDVVFNHTAEGDPNGPTYNFRKLDEASYYIQNPNGEYHNWSGCGNTLNANTPVARQFIVDCLKYWAQEMHVDGFRFDLATSLCRGSDGTLLKHPPLIRAMEAEPALKNIKLIAEAWDCRDYQVGHFPGKRFSDWNGKFRDDIRRFWNHGTEVGPLATRLSGSSDLYGHHKNGSPLKSINFITSHDGFTLADLVSYKQKHNQANQENNRDGENHNDSLNFGIDGPTHDAGIRTKRIVQQKNLLATLLLSQGVPMLTAGDEFGRTQSGNNNAYCQDNEISWVNWLLCETNRELFEFTKKLIALRAAFPQLRRKKFLTGKGDVHWIGPDGREPHWHHDRAIGMYLPGKKRLLILINNEGHAVQFKRPPGKWTLELFTSEHLLEGGEIAPHSLAVFSA